MFAEGFSEQLDEYRSAQKEGKTWILQQENYERERTGIKTLKIGYNRVFGYYIEVSKGAAAQVKEEYGYEMCIRDRFKTKNKNLIILC